MVIIKDYWGREREFEPADYAKEEYRYPSKLFSRLENHNAFELKKLFKHEFGIVTDKQIHDFWLNAPKEDRYLFYRMVAEIELYLDWRLNNGYHLRLCSLDDIEDALDNVPETTDMRAFQIAALAELCWDADQALIDIIPMKNIYKTIFYTYTVAVKGEAPGIAEEAMRDIWALGRLRDYGFDDELIWELLEERIEKEKARVK